jgi:hypothetical protein
MHGPKAGAMRRADLRDMAAVAAVGDAMRMNELRNRVLALKAGQGRGAPGFAPSGQPGGLQRRPAGAAGSPAHAHAARLQAAHAGHLAAGRQKLRVLGHFANHAIRTGDNRALKKLLKLAKSDPHVSRIVPADLDVESTGKHAFRVTATLAPEGLAALAQNAPPGLAAAIAGSPPGRYMYLVDRGRVTDFGAAPQTAGPYSSPYGGGLGGGEADVIPRSTGRGSARFPLPSTAWRWPDSGQGEE